MASLQSQLNSFKLKSVSKTTPHQSSKPKEVDAHQDELEQQELRSRENALIEDHFMVNMDLWVKHLDPNDTINTLVIPLSLPEIKAMLDINPNQEEGQKSAQSPTHAESIQCIASSLMPRLQAAFDQFQAQSRGCFMKLSSRSPKDVALSSPKTFEIYRQLVSQNARLSGVTDPPLLLNEHLQMLYHAMTLSMRVSTVEEGLAMHYQSRRIMWDFKYYLQNPTKEPLSLVVREWLNIPLAFEFRAFVYKGEMTAISQYFSQLYFPHLSALKDSLQRQMLSFWRRIAPAFEYIRAQPDPAHVAIDGADPICKYVIDFALVISPEGEEMLKNAPISSVSDQAFDGGRWIVLEVNPFNISTGSCLFDWASESDSNVLLGRSPFEFRVQPHPVVEKLIPQLHPSWRSIFSTLKSELK